MGFFLFSKLKSSNMLGYFSFWCYFIPFISIIAFCESFWDGDQNCVFQGALIPQILYCGAMFCFVIYSFPNNFLRLIWFCVHCWWFGCQVLSWGWSSCVTVAVQIQHYQPPVLLISLCGIVTIHHFNFCLDQKLLIYTSRWGKYMFFISKAKMNCPYLHVMVNTRD